MDNSYIRIHIRANSNHSIDQDIKYVVKENVVNFLTPIVSDTDNREDVYRKIADNLDGIQRVADRTLQAAGFGYRSQAELKREEFPHRVYDDTVLESGIYDALIINLGTGDGDNWWCVVYPPLCFVGAQGTDENGITYKSKIAEIIRKVTSQ